MIIRNYLLLLNVLLLCSSIAIADTLTIVRAVPIPIENIQRDPLGNWQCMNLKDSIILDAVVARDKVDSTITLISYESSLYSYQLRNDSLFCLGYENATTSMRYNRPQLLAVFPLQVGDSLAASYSGLGEYCHLLPLSIEGISTVVVDGVGSLSLPDMQADNLFRIHVSSSISEILCDTTHYKMDKYIWLYNNANHLPVFEVSETSLIFPSDTIVNRLAYYRVPSLEENTNEINIIQEEELVNQCAFTEARFLPNPVVENLLITYVLVHPAHLRFTLCNRQGLFIYSSSTVYQKEGDYQTSIPMMGLPHDDYVLYIHVDDVILSETIIKI